MRVAKLNEKLAILVVVRAGTNAESLRELTQQILAIQPSARESLQQPELDLYVLIIGRDLTEEMANAARELVRICPPHRVNFVAAAASGLTALYVESFHWGIKVGFNAIIQMPNDGCYRVGDLVPLIAELYEGYEFVVGSRYGAGAKTRSWSLVSYVIDKICGYYCWLQFGYPVRDWTSEFVAWRNWVLSSIDLSRPSTGYGFLVDLKHQCLVRGFKGKEVGIDFHGGSGRGNTIGHNRQKLREVFALK